MELNEIMILDKMQKDSRRLAAIYIRVSTLDQAREGYSLAAQLKALEAWCEQHGYIVYRIYEDAGISAKDIDHRPAMQAMLADIVAGQVDAVIVWSLSRLTRSVADLYGTWEMLRRRGTALISYTEAFDTNTSTGRAMMGLLGVFAQMEREITGERVRAAMAERAAQGKRTCSEVLGYDLSGADSFTPNWVEAERVQYIFDRYEEYRNLSIVAALCANKGYRGKRGCPLTPQHIKKILTCTIYAGYNRFLGQVYKGDYQPIITIAQFNRVQHLLASRTGSGRRLCSQPPRPIKA